MLAKRLVREGVRPYLGRILLSLVFMGIVAGTSALLAALMKPVVDEVFVRRDASMLWPVALGVVATSLAKGFATYFQSNLTAWVGLRIIADMQN